MKKKEGNVVDMLASETAACVSQRRQWKTSCVCEDQVKRHVE